MVAFLRQKIEWLAAKIAPVTVPVIYAVMVILILIFFSGKGEFIYEG